MPFNPLSILNVSIRSPRCILSSMVVRSIMILQVSKIDAYGKIHGNLDRWWGGGGGLNDDL